MAELAAAITWIADRPDVMVLVGLMLIMALVLAERARAGGSAQ